MIAAKKIHISAQIIVVNREFVIIKLVYVFVIKVHKLRLQLNLSYFLSTYL